VNPDGSSPARLTRGREDSTVYRYVALDDEGGLPVFGGGGGRGGGGASANIIDTSKPLILSATGEYNKKSGYAKLTVGQPVQRVLWLDKQVTGLRKAKDADVYLVEEQSFNDSPNFFVAGSSLADAKQVSNTNTFQ